MTIDNTCNFFLLAIMCLQQSRHLTNGLEFHDRYGRCLNGWNCLPQSMHDAFLVPFPVGGCTDGGIFLYDESADNTFDDGVAFLAISLLSTKAMTSFTDFFCMSVVLRASRRISVSAIPDRSRVRF